MKRVQQIYNEELEKRERTVEWEREKQEREKIHQSRNTTENLRKDLKGLNIKR